DPEREAGADGKGLAGGPRGAPRLHPHRRLGQAQAGRAEHKTRRFGRSGRPPEEPPGGGRPGSLQEERLRNYGFPSNSASVATVRGPLSSQTAYFAGYIDTPACSPRAFRT